ncbi:MAG: hypothetical protein WHT07_06475 [Desulfobaccales bacterium]
MTPGTRFRFPLATVLKVSRLREEAARLRLAQALKRVAASRRALTETEELLAKRLAGLEGEASRSFSTEDFLLHLRHLESLSRALAGWRERLQQEEAAAERERQTLLKHHQETRLLEKLRDRAWARFRRGLTRQQEQETEAAVLARFPTGGGG